MTIFRNLRSTLIPVGAAPLMARVRWHGRQYRVLYHEPGFVTLALIRKLRRDGARTFRVRSDVPVKLLTLE